MIQPIDGDGMHEVFTNLKKATGLDHLTLVTHFRKLGGLDHLTLVTHFRKLGAMYGEGIGTLESDINKLGRYLSYNSSSLFASSFDLFVTRKFGPGEMKEFRLTQTIRRKQKMRQRAMKI